MFVGIGVGVHRQRFAGSFATSYSSRVIADGGTIEALDCVVAASSLLQSASLLLIPSGYKAGVAYAELPANGNGDLTWSRNSVANRTNASGLIQQVPWNLVQQSETFDNASWTKFATTITANTALSPNGTLTADNAVPNTTNTDHSLTQSVVQATSGTTYTISVFAKPNGYNFIRLSFGNVAGGGYTFFDVSNGTIGGTSSMLSNSITPVGNGWYRCTVSRTATTSGTLAIDIYIVSANNQFLWAGNGTDGVYIWGAQLVEGTTAQTYLPTTDRLNFPRLDYTYGSCPALLLEPQRTNSLRNSTMQGAVAGTPGTLPTNWGESLNGLVRQSVALGTENGVSYIDIRYSGTATGGSCAVLFETATQIVASTSQTWSNSVYLKIIAQPNPPVAYRLSMWEYNTSGTVFGGSFATAVVPTTTSLQRFTQTRALTGATTDRVRPLFDVSMTSGQSYDFTIRIAAPQMELGAFATTWINTTNAAATRLADTFTRNNIYTNGLISASGGTWYLELRNNVAYTRDATNVGLFIGDDLTNSNGFAIRNTGTGRLVIQKFIATVNSNIYTTLTDTVKIAIKWNGTSADIFANGTKVVSATSFTTTILQFLSSSNNTVVPTFIQAMALYPTPLSDADCTTLTT